MKESIFKTLLGNKELRSKKELIEEFINQNLPHITDDDQIEPSFYQFWDKKKQLAVQALDLFDTHFGNWDSDWRTAQGDIALERRKVHSLRSAAANIGAVRLALDAEVLENFLLTRPDEAATPIAQGLRRQLQHEFDLARDSVRQALATRQVMAH